MPKKKVLVIVGPTASGKSSLAVRLAKKFGGEIISADSRQVYKGLDIGTGKITKKEMWGVQHHLLDVASPKKQFSVSEYKKLAEEKMGKIKFPIIVGGTGFYIDALTGRTDFPEVPPNKSLRKKLNRKSSAELFNLLKKKDPRRAKTIDPNNKVRLVRALEIVGALGKVPTIPKLSRTLEYKFIYVGLKPDNLDERIYKRLIKRISGIIRETKKLPFERAYELGLEYRYAAIYLKKKISKKEFVEKLNTAIRHYAKRQMTWFKRNKEIKWFTLSSVEGFKPDEYGKIEKYVKRMIG
ncbi:MAG: tRNA (adenosine(37)-N6)-dimethylallyltransferase MiaA [Minisyncoccia bacterium]